MKFGFMFLLALLLASCGVPASSNPSTPSTATAAVDAKIALQEDISELLGTIDGTLPRLRGISYSFPEKGDITITWEILDAGSQASTIQGAQMDAVNILKVLEKNKTRFLYVILSGMYSTIDEFGYPTEIEAMNLGFNKSNLNTVDWEKFEPAELINLADVSVIHPFFH